MTYFIWNYRSLKELSNGRSCASIGVKTKKFRWIKNWCAYSPKVKFLGAAAPQNRAAALWRHHALKILFWPSFEVINPRTINISLEPTKNTFWPLKAHQRSIQGAKQSGDRRIIARSPTTKLVFLSSLDFSMFLNLNWVANWPFIVKGALKPNWWFMNAVWFSINVNWGYLF